MIPSPLGPANCLSVSINPMGGSTRTTPPDLHSTGLTMSVRVLPIGQLDRRGDPAIPSMEKYGGSQDNVAWGRDFQSGLTEAEVPIAKPATSYTHGSDLAATVSRCRSLRRIHARFHSKKKDPIGVLKVMLWWT